MSDTTPVESKEWVLKRLLDPIKIFGTELSPDWWWGVLAVVLGAAFFYVGWMYLKDSRTVGWAWASVLGLLRSLVYVILAFVFLLPAELTTSTISVGSSAGLAVDVSGSFERTRDGIPEAGQKFEDLPTRADMLIAFLEDKKINFIGRLEENNPITAFRFGPGLDGDNSLRFADGRVWTHAELEALKNDKAATPPPKGRIHPQLLRAWLKPTTWVVDPKAFAAQPKDVDPEGKMTPEELGKALEARKEDLAREKARVDELVKANAKLNVTGFFGGTNVGDSALAAMKAILDKRPQGLIIVTDGRSTETSTKAFRDLAALAKEEKVPIFVVGVGTVRKRVRIDLGELRLPQVVQPEDRFRVVAPVTGEELADELCPLTVEVTHVRLTEGKEEELDIFLEELFDPKQPDKKRDRITLGKKIVLRPAEPLKFDRGSPPRVEGDFALDPGELARHAGIDLKDPKYAGKKWGLGETEPNRGEKDRGSELRFKGVVPKHKLEIGVDPQHFSPAAGLRVIKRPLRVLIFAGSPSRDYQFTRALMLREMQKGQAELSVCLQQTGDPKEVRVGMLQDPLKKRFLLSFPSLLDGAGPRPSRPDIPDYVQFLADSDFAPPGSKEKDLFKVEDYQHYDLSNYDVVLAFDPDWSALTEDQFKKIKLWVDKGGGLVVVGGTLNTLQLIRPTDKEKFKPLLDLLPVVLQDNRLDGMDRKTDRPWPLDFSSATPSMEFLKLAEGAEPGADKFLHDWQLFFGVPDNAPDKTAAVRGIYGLWPLKSTKPGTQIVARFTDPAAAPMADGSKQAYMVTTVPSSGRRVVWIGSSELWRLRQYKEAFHERFWTKLARYAGAGSQGKTNKRITLVMGSTYTANKWVDVEAKIDGKGGEPLPFQPDRAPIVTVSPPKDVGGDAVEVKMEPKTGAPGWFKARFMVRDAGKHALTLRVPETGDTENGTFLVERSDPELDDTRPDFRAMYYLATEADEVLSRLGKEDRDAVEKALQRPKFDKADDKPAKADEKQPAKGGATQAPPAEEKSRLYFDLGSAHLIPLCLKSVPKERKTPGKPRDLWDEGLILWGRTAARSSTEGGVTVDVRATTFGVEPAWAKYWVTENDKTEQYDSLDDVPRTNREQARKLLEAVRKEKPTKISYVLMVVVGLLSVEWLTRKLLRLA
jgi:hypothetical protein